jgi:hypothetical protein
LSIPDEPDQIQQETESTDDSNTRYDEVSARQSTLPNFTISMTGFANEEKAQKIGTIVRDYLLFFGKLMDLGALSRVWITYQYEETLASLDRGVETQDKLTPTQDDVAVGVRNDSSRY